MSTIARSTVAIVGGGLVGASAALAMARLGFSVTLIERRKPQLSVGKLGIDIRNVALSPASAAMFEGFGIWQQIVRAPYSRMCVWEQWGDGRVEFDAAEVGRSELGWLVEVSPLVLALWDQLQQAANVEILLAEIETVVPQASAVDVQFVAAAKRSFDFVVAADGAHSVVRRALKVGLLEQPVDQVALASVVRTARSHQHTAWQRFLHEGPLALLPAPDQHICSIVWSQSEAGAARRLALSDEEFCAELEHAVESQLGEVQEVDARLTFPLTQLRVQSCAPHARVLLIGDAMRVVHPLAGLGVNLGLEDVCQLVEVAKHHADLSYPGIWRRYARGREARSQMMIHTLGLIQKLYADSSPTMALLRNFGIRSFNALGGVKHQVMREAMGLGQLSGRARSVSG